MDLDFATLVQRFRSFRGLSLLIMLVAAILNFATGNPAFGLVFLVMTVFFAIRLARTDPNGRGPRRR